jgi:hypothetical protein
MLDLVAPPSRHDTEGRRYDRRRLAEDKPRWKHSAHSKRRLSDVVFRQILTDTKQLETGPGTRKGDFDIRRGRPSTYDRHFGQSLPDPPNHSLKHPS